MTNVKTRKGIQIRIDAENYDELSKLTWTIVNGYAVWCKRVDGRNKTFYMHRMLMMPDKYSCIDHINGNRLDNRKSNLRICVRAQNNKSRSLNSNNTSGYKGVKLREGRWAASINSDKRHIHIGYFATKEEAAREYDRAAVKYHGEFARINFA